MKQRVVFAFVVFVLGLVGITTSANAYRIRAKHNNGTGQSCASTFQ